MYSRDATGIAARQRLPSPAEILQRPLLAVFGCFCLVLAGLVCRVTAGSDDELVVHYTFDADTGTNVWDSSGNGNHAYRVGSVSYEAGLSGLAPRFSSQSTYIVSPSSVLNVSGWRQITVSLWLCMKAYPLEGAVLMRGQVTGTVNGGISMFSGGARNGQWVTPGYFAVFTNSNTYVGATSATFQPGVQPLPLLNCWYHVVGSYDGTNICIFVDGVLESTRAVTVKGMPLWDIPTTKLVIGNHAALPKILGSDFFFNGLVDEVRIYRRALSAEEVRDLCGRPMVVTRAVTGISARAAIGSGDVVADGGDPVAERGLCWASAASPTMANASVVCGAGVGEFAGALTNLNIGTWYHVRAWARNGRGVGYGADVAFRTLGNTITASAGQYGTIVPSGTVGVEPDGSAAFTLTPDPDCRVMDVLVDGHSVGATNQYTFLGVTTNHTIQAIFAAPVVADASFDPGSSSYVYAVAQQPDGKILVGGEFTTLAGQARSRIGRLNADGTLDTAFNPVANERVNGFTLQADGKILVSGRFTTMNGQTRNCLARLNADGTLDTGFNPGANNYVYPLVVQPDSKILAVGRFTTLGGQTRNYIGRLEANGNLDSGFNPNANGRIYSVAVQPDGKIVVCGQFTTIGGQSRSGIARLDASGNVDAAFNPGAVGSVEALALQADGKILMAGELTSVAGQPRNYLARVNANGTLDTGFNPSPNAYLYCVAVQADGKILFSGEFTTVGGQPRGYLARVKPDGTLDSGFRPDANGGIYCVTLQMDGRMLAAGGFATIAGVPRANIARLTTTDEATQSVICHTNTLQWLRGGTSPEVWRTTFEHSYSGTAWSLLGAGTRTTGGWQIGGVRVTGGVFRVRGYTVGGRYGASLGITQMEAPYQESYTQSGTAWSWLARHSLTNDLTDTDGDGLAEWAEYLAGTDPTNTTSVFAIPPSQQQALPDNSGFVVRWPSIAERLYSVDRSTDLMFEPFLPLATNLPPTPPMNVYTDAAAGLSNAAYRVRVRQR